MRVFLGANILFSAAKSDGAVRALVRLLLDRGHACQVDAYVVAEARRNLINKGPQAVQVLDALLGRLQVAPALAGAAGAVELAWLPPKDRPVLAAAIHLGCDALVTGDRKHFGSAYGRKVGGVAIHSPRSLAEAVLALGG
jgi:predicted nucleic acid-binding protein